MSWSVPMCVPYDCYRCAMLLLFPTKFRTRESRQPAKTTPAIQHQQQSPLVKPTNVLERNGVSIDVPFGLRNRRSFSLCWYGTRETRQFRYAHTRHLACTTIMFCGHQGKFTLSAHSKTSGSGGTSHKRTFTPELPVPT